jgi:hypothetical protein
MVCDDHNFSFLALGLLVVAWVSFEQMLSLVDGGACFVLGASAVAWALLMVGPVWVSCLEGQSATAWASSMVGPVQSSFVVGPAAFVFNGGHFSLPPSSAVPALQLQCLFKSVNEALCLLQFVDCNPEICLLGLHSLLCISVFNNYFFEDLLLLLLDFERYVRLMP